MTMISRVLGLARDVVFAWFIGASGGADAFFVAFKIPNFLRRLFAEGAFAQAFVPVLSEYREKGSQQAIQDLVDRVAGCLGLSLISISALAVLAAPVLTMVFAPGFYWSSPEKFGLTVDLIRITFPYLALISMAGFAGSILNSHDRFAVPAVTPVLLNLILIVSAVWVSPLMTVPVHALAWGVLLAGVTQFGFQLPFLAQIHLLPKPKVDWNHPGVKKILSLMAPALFGVSVSQINLLLDTVIASLITDVAIATVILPSLSRQASAGAKSFNSTLDWALRTVLLIAIPAMVALFVLGFSILVTLFQHGSRFTLEDTSMSTYSLFAYALGLPAFMLIKVLLTGYFSRQDTRSPVKIGIIAMLANMVMNVIFVTPLYFLFELGHVGLALATSLAAYVNAFLLYRGLRKNGNFTPESGWLQFLMVLGLATSVMAVVLYTAQNWVPYFPELSVWGRIGHILWLCLAGGVIYFVTLYLCGWRLSQFKPKSLS